MPVLAGFLGSLMPLVLLVQRSYMMDQLEDDQSM